MLQAAYSVANAVTITQTAAQGLVREWTVSSAGTTKATSGFADGVQAAAGASGNKTATWVTSSLWTTQLFALKNEAADGSGTVAATLTTASASDSTDADAHVHTRGGQHGERRRLRRRARRLDGDAVNDAGRRRLRDRDRRQRREHDRRDGNGAMDGRHLRVTLNQGSAQALVVKIGDTSGGGPGVTAPATTGAVAWSTKERSSSRGTLTALAVSPTITVYAADGAGTVASSLSSVSGSQAGLTETLTYTAPAGGLANGTLTVTVPAGWTAPVTSAGPGFTTSSVGTVSVLGQTITVTGVTRAAAQTVVLTYGFGATAAAATGPGPQSWQVMEASTAGGCSTALAVSPTITMYAPDGSGTHDADDERLRLAGRQHCRAHVHRRDGRHAERRRQADDPDRLERTLDQCRRRRIHDVERGTVAVAAQVVTVPASRSPRARR